MNRFLLAKIKLMRDQPLGVEQIYYKYTPRHKKSIRIIFTSNGQVVEMLQD